MATDPRYVLMQDLESYFVDKSTGLPLSNGYVRFWVDDNRTTPKAVYEQTGSPPNYIYTPLPNPLPLSGVGTPQNAVGDNVAVYYYPYDDFGNIETYFVQAFSSDNTEQFTRQNWPFPNVNADASGSNAEGSFVNELSNPQFVDVNFDPSIGLTIPVSGSNVTVNFAPNWYIDIQSTGIGTVEIERTSVAGSAKDATNPSYFLSVSSSGLVSSLRVYQRLTNNPNIWARTNASGTGNGFVATTVMLTPSSTVTIKYEPNSGAITTLLNASNTLGTFSSFNSTVQLPLADNASTADTGYVDIAVYCTPGMPTSFSSIQIVGLEDNIVSVPYEQAPANRQKALLFDYYKPKLAYKPIESYLVGWDFGLNPAQILGDSVGAQALGVNTAYYAWDQTILFQTVTSGITVSRGTNGGLQLVAAANGQIALIQYLDQPTAKKIFNDRMSVNIAASTTRVGGLAGKVTIWACSDVALPVLPLSIVATLDSTGKPATRTGNWTEVTRSGLGDAYFNLTAASATNDESADIKLFGWDMQGAALANTATYFAIVVGFSAWTTADAINVRSISLCPGDIPTRPCPKTYGETLLDCERYYEMSYLNFAAVGTATLNNALVAAQAASIQDGANFNFYQSAFSFDYKTVKATTPTIAIYSPSGTAGNVQANVWGPGAAGIIAADKVLATYWGSVGAISNKGANYQPGGVLTAGPSVGGTAGTVGIGWIRYHYIADARLGVV